MDIDSIGIGVETRQVKQASKDLDKLGSSADKASRKADNLTNSSKKLDREQRNLATSTERAKGAFSAMSAVLPVLGFAALTRAVVKSSDTYTKFNAQLRVATTGQAQFNEAQKEVVRIAQVAQVEVGAIGSVYARFSLALKDAGTTQAEVSRITETLSLALKVNGATAEESSSAMLQLSQAFGKGKLDGDEFRTAMEAMPNVMRELAKSMGVPFGALKDLAEQGAITSDELVKAFTNTDLLNALRKNAEDTQTIAGAWTNVKNAISLAIGKAAEYFDLPNKLNEASRTFSEAFSEGGLFGGKTSGQQAKANQDELWQIEQQVAETQKRIRLANMQLGNKGRLSTLNRQLDSLQSRRAQIMSSMDSRFGNKIGAGGIEGYTGAPSFMSGGIVVDDVNKIHARQKELERELTKTKKDNLEDVAQKQFEIEKRAYEAAQEMLDANKEYADKLEKEKFETRQKWLDLEQKRADENFKAAQEANERFEQERRREAERTSDIISRSLTDALLRGFESGKSFADNFIDTLKNMFRTLVLQPVIKFLVDSSGISRVLGALGGVFSGSASASTGSNSVLGALGGIKDVIGSLNGSLVSSIENLGVFLSTGNGGLGDAIGGFLGQYASEISNVLPFAGAALNLLSGNTSGAIGSALGAALTFTPLGPVGGIIGSVVGSALSGLFGGKDYDRFGSEVRTQSNNGVISDYMSGKIYDKDIGGQSQLSSLNSAFLSTFSDFTQSFGGSGNAAVGSGIFQRGKSGITGGLFNAYANGQEINLNVSLKDSNPSAVFQALAEKAMGEGLAKAIQSSDVQDGIKKFFNGLISSEDVTATIQTLTTLKASLQDLPDVFKAIQFEIDTTLFGSNAAQITSRFQALSNYTNLFYSDSEKFETAFKQLTSQFGALGQALPTTREGYRALIDGFEVFDEASANTFYGLVSLAPALDAFYGGINDINNALADGLNKNLYSTYADYVSAQATVSAGGDASGFMARINNPVAMNKVMAEEIKMLRESNAEMKTILAQIAFNTKKTKDIQREWNGDGLPTERTY